MGIAWTMVDLRAWDPRGGTVPDKLFISRLRPRPTPVVLAVVKSDSPWQAARLTVAAAELSKFRREKEPTEAWAATLTKQLIRAGRWLTKFPAGALNELRRKGYEADVVVTAWIDQDQFDVVLPVEFVAGCARHKLSISVHTND